MKSGVMDYIYVDEIIYESGIIKVDCNFKQPPASIEEVELWTTAIAVDITKILSKYNIEMNVSVWGQKKMTEGIKIYGRTLYSSIFKDYEFEKFK